MILSPLGAIDDAAGKVVAAAFRDQEDAQGYFLLLRQLGAAEVVDAPFEASLEFVRRLIQRFGIDAGGITAIQSARRGRALSHRRLSMDDDPNDPRHRDFDLSEAAGWDFDSSRVAKPWFLRRWVLLLVAALIIAALVISLLPR
jgi:hypothetical protein